MKPALFPSSTWNDIRNEVETCLRYLFRRELQEWGADRFYIVISEDREIAPLARAGGFMTRHFSQSFRISIDQRFTTHGPGMFIDTDKIGPCSREAFLRFCEIAIHETAHIVQEQYPANHFSQIVDRKPSKRRASALAPTAVEPPTDDQKRYGPRLVNWTDNFKFHQADFVRSLVHVESRAQLSGWEPQEHRGTFGIYVPGSIWGFQMALESELNNYADRSLNRIWEQEPPEMFTGGWERLHRAPQTWMTRITHSLIELDAAERREREVYESNVKRSRKRRELVQVTV